MVELNKSDLQSKRVPQLSLIITGWLARKLLGAKSYLYLYMVYTIFIVFIGIIFILIFIHVFIENECIYEIVFMCAFLKLYFFG